MDSGHPSIQPASGQSDHADIPEDFQDELHHREVALEFIGPGYECWNDGDDDAFEQCKAKAQQTYGTEFCYNYTLRKLISLFQREETSMCARD